LGKFTYSNQIALVAKDGAKAGERGRGKRAPLERKTLSGQGTNKTFKRFGTLPLLSDALNLKRKDEQESTRGKKINPTYYGETTWRDWCGKVFLNRRRSGLSRWGGGTTAIKTRRSPDNWKQKPGTKATKRKTGADGKMPPRTFCPSNAAA